jgi:beta-lactamase class A
MLAEVEELLEEVPARVCVYGRNLTTGEELALDPDRVVPTGSAAKTFLLLAYARQVAEGHLDPDRRVELPAAADHRIGGSGVLRYLGGGLRPSLDDLAWLMMLVSDNVATDLLLDAVGGRTVVNEVMDAVGLTDARVEEDSVWVYPPRQFGRTTARALAGVWSVLVDPGAVGYPADAAERCLRITARHQLQNGFARHLPWNVYAADFGMSPKVRLWSKGGSYPGVQCEGGLFETDEAQWVLAVTLDELKDQRGGAAGAGSTALAAVSLAVYERWAERS